MVSSLIFMLVYALCYSLRGFLSFLFWIILNSAIPDALMNCFRENHSCYISQRLCIVLIFLFFCFSFCEKLPVWKSVKACLIL